MYLAIDTSTNAVSIALFEEHALISKTNWRSKRNHTSELIPTLYQMLERANYSLQDLKGVVVARGPGSFSGLRVGITTAKGLALSLGIPLVGINTLEAWTYQYAGIGLPVCGIIEMGRGEVGAAVYRWHDSEPERMLEEHVSAPTELCRKISGPTIFCGEMKKETIEVLRSNLGESAHIIPPSTFSPSPFCLGRLGLVRFQLGQKDDPATLQPLYLRRPSITRPAKAMNSGQV